MKLSIIVLISLIFAGCVSIETRNSYTPQKVANWKELSNRIYQFSCNGGEIEVSPIVLRPTIVGELEKPWIFVRFHVPKRIETCDLSFVTLENKISGERVTPISAKPNVFNNDQTIPIYNCYYYFDIKEDKASQYVLHISDKVLGCAVAPIPYIYEKYTEWWPMDIGL
jgi:hypothetical protein